MTLFNFTHAQRAEIRSRYASGETLRSLAEAFGCSSATIHKRVISTDPAFVPGKRSKARPLQFTPEDRAAILAAYGAGEPLRELGLRYGCSAQTLHKKVIKASGLFQPGYKKQRFTPAQKQEMANRYEAGESLRAIAADFDCTAGNVRYVVMSCGVQPRSMGRHGPDEPTLALVRERREAGVSHQRLADELGVAKHTVISWCRAMGLPGDPRMSGPAHHAWKGGRTRSSHGYINVKVASTDPFASMADTGGYVAEHRLVMARSLGRPLRPDETVHHRNGDREDNRLENLQLRQGKHGKGVKAQCLDCGSLNIGHPEL